MSRTTIDRQPKFIGRRTAFTLVELLVVITIIGILIALLVPAVQQAREAARRAQCSNNLKQIGLAMYNYHDSHQCFPPGYMVITDQGFGNDAILDEQWGWPVFLLPYLDQQTLYDDLEIMDFRLCGFFKKMGNEIPDERNREMQLAKKHLGSFRCPSDSTDDILPKALRDFGIGNGVDYLNKAMVEGGKGYQPATSNYIGMAGYFRRSSDFPNTGVLYGRSAIKFNDIGDGLGNVFMVGERNKRCMAGAWVGINNPFNIASSNGIWYVEGIVSDKLNHPLQSRCQRGFSSSHPNGANFLLCDGSCVFINDGISSVPYDAGILMDGKVYYIDPLVDFPGDITVDLARRMGVYQQLGMREDGAAILDEFRP